MESMPPTLLCDTGAIFSFFERCDRYLSFFLFISLYLHPAFTGCIAFDHRQSEAKQLADGFLQGRERRKAFSAIEYRTAINEP